MQTTSIDHEYEISAPPHTVHHHLSEMSKPCFHKTPSKQFFHAHEMKSAEGSGRGGHANDGPFHACGWSKRCRGRDGAPLTGSARQDEGDQPLGDTKRSSGTPPTSESQRTFLRALPFPSSSSEDVESRGGGAPRDTTPNSSALLLIAAAMSVSPQRAVRTRRDGETEQVWVCGGWKCGFDATRGLLRDFHADRGRGYRGFYQIGRFQQTLNRFTGSSTKRAGLGLQVDECSPVLDFGASARPVVVSNALAPVG